VLLHRRSRPVKTPPSRPRMALRQPCPGGGGGGQQHVLAEPPELPPDGWQAVAEQLTGLDPADGATWRGVLRGVCRAARDGVDATTLGRCMDPCAFTSRLELLAWAAEQSCPWPWAEDCQVFQAAKRMATPIRVATHIRLAEICEWAAEAGRLAVLKWAVDSMGCDAWQLCSTACDRAAKGGHPALLQWAREQGCPWSSRTCAAAAEGGHLKVLQWLRARGCPWRESTCMSAARRGDIEMLQWARAQGCPWRGGDICTVAAREGHLNVLRWVKEQGCPWGRDTCSRAAERGDLEMLRWARAQG